MLQFLNKVTWQSIRDPMVLPKNTPRVVVVVDA
jgi:hypothetical protein